ncbi:hypothetical protein T484DRAFT_1818402, partial [Baffinella frigidus]
YVSSTSAVCSLPTRAAGTVTVTVSNNGVDFARFGAPFVYGTESGIDVVVPSVGPAGGGTLVQVRYSGAPVAVSSGVCVFGEMVVAAEIRAGGAVFCVVPAGAVGTVAVLVRDAQGQALVGGAGSFLYFEAPAVTGVLPSRGSVAGGAVVSVVGTALAGSAGVQCRFGAAVVRGSEVRVVSSTLVTCLSPTSAGGVVALEVSVNGGADYSSSGRTYLFERAVVLSSVVPSRGKAGTADQVVTIVGEHFAHSQELSCRFGVNGTVRGLFLSSTLIACTAPSRGAGTVQLSVSLNGAEQSGGLVLFEYGVAGGMDMLRPSRGPMSGGSLITVHGTGLVSTGTYKCLFGSRQVKGTVVGTDSVRCATPSSSVASTLSVRLMMEGETLPGSVSYDYYETPTIVSILPSRGGVAGGSHVSIVGTGFTATDLQCRFGTQFATGDNALYVTSTLITCVTPSGVGAGSVGVEVSVNGGSDYTSDGRGYLYEATVTVEGVWPSQGHASGEGQVVTVVGEHFEQTGELSCRFGMSGRVRARYLSSSLLDCIAPARGAGVVQVSVSVNGVDSSSGSAPFAYLPRASVRWISPSSGP